ncbi:hypothetical protein Dsin_014024 [Dipteronia sinensis]|uniref:MATH domain-containing protein n=1 Tax=Dipteronia sinensis TaxID=43782 RepID=A0AAE0AMA2_9ROSI|nr:hypothetical protein Dsin_014024 [Dipteronia sinensis]
MATGAILLKGRNAPPSHCLFKIESFSLLSNSSIEKFCSGDFEAGDYEWKLWIYPTGDNKRNVKDHISFYLELVDTSSLPAGWEVNVVSNFFIYNHLQNKYLSNTEVVQTRYHSLNTIIGITKFIDLDTFSDPGNGYLIDDTCVFGMEVFVVKNSFKEECLSMMREPIKYYHTWKVTDFSSLVDDKYVSKSFGCYKWYISLYPNGNGEGNGHSISIFLNVSCSSIPHDKKLFVKFLLRVKDQMNRNHIVHEGDYLYAPSNIYNSSGWRDFLSLAKLKDSKKGYLMDDTLIIEAEVTLFGLVITKS